MKKKFLLSSFFLVLAIGAIGLFNLKETEKIMAAPAGYLDIKDAPGINIVSRSGANVEIPGEYGSMFKLTSDVSYVSSGTTKINNLSSYALGVKSVAYEFNPLTDKGEKSVLVKNAGLYQGRKVDLKFVIDSFDFKFKKDSPKEKPNFYFVGLNYDDINKTDRLPISSIKTWGEMYLTIGASSAEYTGFYEEYQEGDRVYYHYEMYDSETSAPIEYKGTWNFNNINGLKSVSIPFEKDDFSSLYVMDNTWVGYQKDTPTINYLELYGETLEVNSISSRITDLISTSSYSLEVTRRVTGVSNELMPMGLMYTTQSLARIAPAAPIVYGEKNSATHTEADYLKMKYSILQVIPDNIASNRDSEIVLTSEVPSMYDVDLSSVKVFEYGTDNDLTDLWEVTADPANSSKLVLTAKDSTSDAFNGKVYSIQVTASPNATFAFDKDSTLYNYQTGGVDDGHMVFEEGGVKTQVYYDYNNKQFSNTLSSAEVAGQSQAKVLYEGVASADAKKGLSVSVDGDISAIFPNPSDLLENIKTDTENPIDEVASIEYQGTFPDTSKAGETVYVTVVITTKKGVTTTVEVPILVENGSSSLTVEFLNEDDSTLRPSVVFSDLTVGDTVSLSSKNEITSVLAELNTADYELISSPSSNDVEIIAGGVTVTYKFRGQLMFKSAPTSIDFGLKTTDNYSAVSADKPQIDQPLVVYDNRVALKSWTLTAKLLKPLTSMEDATATLPEALKYKNDDAEGTLAGDTIVTIKTYSDSEVSQQKGPYSYDVSDDEWTKKGNGFKLELASGEYRKMSEYQGIIQFTLEDTK